MNIDYELYKIFYEIATIGNITRASQKLNISQPALSKSIRNLESQLGGDLFVRTQKGVVLTEEGKLFYNHIKSAIENITNAENEFTNLMNLNTGSIRIGVSTTITEKYLLPYLKEFHELYPNITIHMYTDISNELLNKLKNGLIDLAIVHVIDKDYEYDIDICKIKKIHSCFVVNDTFKELLGKEISLKDLTKYPIILQTKGSNSRDFIERIEIDNNIIFNNNIESSSYTLISEFAKIGLGIGISTKEYIEKDLKDKLLFEIKIKEKLPDRYIGVATLKKQNSNFSTKKFIEIINSKIN
ncbi:MAG: LysR family transcriptional regulator [Firmicutes bacterium]|nr:LysR family transcriptional regulator [Bacillota bacterium]